MPSAYQFIDKGLMLQVQACLAWRRARRHRINGKRLVTKDVLDEIIELGLERYAERYGIQLPEQLDKEEK